MAFFKNRVSRNDSRGRSAPALLAGLLLVGAGVASMPSASPVQAADADPLLVVQTAGGTVRDGSVIENGTAVALSVGSLLEEGSGSRELRLDLPDGAVYQAGGVTAPEGWTVEFSTNGGDTWVSTEPGTASDVTNIRATSTVTAGAISDGSQIYSTTVTSPIPASTFGAATGGDGWDVFFYDNYVLNIFHHQYSYVAVDCHYRSDPDGAGSLNGGDRCEGWNPSLTSGEAHSKFDGYRAANKSGGWVYGETGELYAFTAEVSSGKPGVLCIDLNTSPPENCGFTALGDSTNISSYDSLSNAEGNATRLFGAETTNDELLCFDAVTGVACQGSPVSVGAANRNKVSVLAAGDRVFVATDVQIGCWNTSDLTTCAGAWPAVYATLGWNHSTYIPLLHADASGVVNGVCSAGGCLDLAGQDVTYHATENPTGWKNPFVVLGQTGGSYVDQYGAFATSGTRAYIGPILSPGSAIYCFDFITEEACAEFDGSASVDNYVYAYRADPNNPNCIWWNSDPGKIGLFDAVTGATECSGNPVITLQPSAFAPRFVCTTNGGIDRWRSVALSSTTGGGTAESQALTIRTGNGAAVAGWSDVDIDVAESKDLTSLSVDATGARPTFNVGFTNVTGSIESATFDISYEGRGPELCVDVVLDNTDVTGAPNCPLLTSTVGTLSENVTAQTTATAESRSFTIGGDATECPEDIVYASPPGPVQNLRAVSKSGTEVTVTFDEPADDGGSPIRWFEYSTDGGSTWRVASTTSPEAGKYTFDVTSLTAGTEVTVVVRAVNAIGDSTNESASATPVATTTTAAPTTTTIVPTRDPDGVLPEASDPAVIVQIVDGVRSELASELVNGDRRVVTGDGFTMTLAGTNSAGARVAANESSGRLRVNNDGKIQTSGTGFSPGSLAHVWLFSDPVFIGTLTVDADGNFSGEMDVPQGIPLGDHTVQVNGETADGTTRSLNVGIEIVSTAELPATGSTSAATLSVLLLAAGCVMLVVAARRRSV